MKICLECGHGPVSEDWVCPACHHQPDKKGGYLSFAPQFSGPREDYPPDQYPILAELESESFWLRARSQLITWSLKKHFQKIDNFLEVGCGTGLVLSNVSSAFPHLDLSATEIDPEGFEYVSKITPKAKLMQMDGRQIPFKEEFDVIGAFDVIEHIEEDEAVLSQIYNACRTGGGVIITVPQHPWLWSEFDTYACHKRRYIRSELKSKMETAGFQICCLTSFVSFLLPVMGLARLFRNKKKTYDPMDQQRIPPLANKIFYGVMALERMLLKSGLSLPVGGSLLCVGLKK
jgi:SAM-dependent methyltransferase